MEFLYAALPFVACGATALVCGRAMMRRPKANGQELTELRSFVLPSFGVQRLLPATGDTTIELGELDPGVYEYTCGMGMYSGSIEVAT